MLFAPKEKGQGLVEYALISCFGRDCCNRYFSPARPRDRQCLQYNHDFDLICRGRLQSR